MDKTIDPVTGPESGFKHTEEDDRSGYDKPFGAEEYPKKRLRRDRRRKAESTLKMETKFRDAEWRLGRGTEGDLTVEMIVDKLRSIAFVSWGDTVANEKVLSLQLKALELLGKYKRMFDAPKAEDDGDEDIVSRVKEAQKNVERIRQDAPQA
jgi:hypothetical protein